MTRGKTRSRGRTVAYTVVASGILAVVLFVVCEIVLRFAGYDVLYTTPVDIQVEPGARLFESDSILGYRHLAGAFRVTVRDSLTFGVTHNADGLRIILRPSAQRRRSRNYGSSGDRSFTVGRLTIRRPFHGSFKSVYRYLMSSTSA